MQLLQDVFIIEHLQILSEGKQKDVMKIRGVFARCNEKNNNGRIYPTAVIASQLEKVQPLIAERRLCGELDHPQNDTVRLANASHLITKLELKGNDLIGEAEILKTPAGLTAKALVDGGVKIGISSRGMGTLSEDHNGDKIVNEDYRLITFDLVADPSTRGAYPGISESTESKFVRESQSKLKKEGTFVTLLNSKLRDAYQPWIEEDAKKGYPGIKGGTKAAKREEKKLQSKGKYEAFELVKADGHWHRIAEAILGTRYSDERMKDFTPATDAEVADSKKARDKKAAKKKAAKDKPKTENCWTVYHQIGKLFLEDYASISSQTAASSELAKIAKTSERIRRHERRQPFVKRGVEARTGRKAAKRGGRRSADKPTGDRRGRRRAVVDSTSYEQVGKLFLENNKEDTESRFAAGQAAAEADKVERGPRERGEGLAVRAVRQRADRIHARKLQIAQAKGGVQAEKITAKGKVRAVRTAAGEVAKTARVQQQQTNRQARQQAAIASAKPGSFEHQGLRGAAREAGSKAGRRVIDRIRGGPKKTPVSTERGRKPAEPVRTAPKNRGKGRVVDVPATTVEPKEGGGLFAKAAARSRKTIRRSLAGTNPVRKAWEERRRFGENLERSYKQIGMHLAEMYNLVEKKDWIQGAVNPEHEGFCTPMTKATCTPRRKALAKRFKKAGRREGTKAGGKTGWKGKV